jgi:hypothetical protein
MVDNPWTRLSRKIRAFVRTPASTMPSRRSDNAFQRVLSVSRSAAARSVTSHRDMSHPTLSTDPSALPPAFAPCGRGSGGRFDWKRRDVPRLFPHSAHSEAGVPKGFTAFCGGCFAPCPDRMPCRSWGRSSSDEVDSERGAWLRTESRLCTCSDGTTMTRGGILSSPHWQGGWRGQLCKRVMGAIVRGDRQAYRPLRDCRTQGPVPYICSQRVRAAVG